MNDYSTSPEALMDMRIRFQTARGSRTYPLSNVPLSDAQQIVRDMIRAGHYAEYFPAQAGTMTIAERIHAKRTNSNIINLNALKGGINASVTGGSSRRS